MLIYIAFPDKFSHKFGHPIDNTIFVRDVKSFIIMGHSQSLFLYAAQHMITGMQMYGCGLQLRRFMSDVFYK